MKNIFTMQKYIALLFVLLSNIGFAQVANDACDNAQAIALPSSGSACVSGTNVGATSDNSINACDVGAAGNEVWFKYVVTGSNNTISVKPSGATPATDLVITLIDDVCGSGIYTDCDSAMGSGTATILEGLVVGSTVLISVETNGTDGTFELCISSLAPDPSPGNVCSAASLICDKSDFTISSMSSFTSSGVKPSCFTGPGSGPAKQDLWIKFTVGKTGTLEWLGTPRGTAEFDWAIFDITAGCLGTEVACNYEIVSGGTVTFGMWTGQGGLTDVSEPITVTAGQTYAMLIDNFNANGVGFDFTWGGTFEMGTTASFTASPTTSCTLPLDVNITNTSVGATSYSWNFGNGTTSTSASPGTVTYNTSGDYIISLVASGGGCTDVATQRINLNAGPVISITPSAPQICNGQSANLAATIALGTPKLPVTFNNTTSTSIPNASTTGANPTISVTGMVPTTLYTGMVTDVCFTINHTRHADINNISLTSPNGTKIQFTTTALPNFNGSKTYCFTTTQLNGFNTGNSNGTWTLNVQDNVNCTGPGGNCTVNTGSVTSWTMTMQKDNSITGYTWSPTTNMTNSTTLTPTVTPTATTTYTLSATDANGCAGSKAVTVIVKPAPTATVPSSFSVCTGATVAASSYSSTPSGATYTWTNSNTAIGLAASGSGNTPAFTATNSTTSPISGTITVTPTLNGCTGTPSTYTITVNPPPTVTVPSSFAACAGSTVAASNYTITPSGASVSWTNSNTSIGLAASGTGNTPSFTATNSTGSPISGTITVTPSISGCSGNSQTYTITVNPTPSMTAPVNSTVCPGTTIASTSFSSTPSGATYAWTNSNTSIGLAGSGTGNVPSFTTTNSTGSAISGNITVTPTIGSCSGTPVTYTVTVNPNPVITSASKTDESACGANDGTITINATGSGLTYSINGGSTFVANGGSFTGLAAGSYTIAVRNSSGCVVVGSTLSISAAGAPAAPAASSNTPLCAGSTLNLSVTSPVGGTTYTWTGPGGYTATGASVSRANVTTAMAGTYSVTATASGCTSPSTNLTIEIKPLPVATVPASATYCSGNTVPATSFTSTPSGATYTWSNSNTAIGLGASGSGNIASFIATNSSSSSISGTISVVPTLNGCAGSASTYTITVNPTPTATVPSSAAFCAGNPVPGSSFTSTPTGATFNWTNTNSSIGLAASGSGNYSGFTATNATGAPISGTISVTPSLNGCTGSAATYTITVKPLPVIANTPSSSTICPGTVVAATTLSSAPTGATYSWTNTNTAIGLAANGSGDVPQFTASNSGNSDIAGTITLTPTLSGCAGPASSYTITVNPAPTLTNSPLTKAICSGDNTGITLTSGITGTTFNYSAALTTGTITGFTASASGVTSINDVLSNTTTNAGSVTYSITPIGPAPTSCSGETKDYVVTVNPIPVVANQTPAPICSGTAFAVTPTGVPTGTTYTWTAPVINPAGSITGSSAETTGQSSISQTLTNGAGVSSATATYTVTPLSGTCSGNSFTVTVTVTKPLMTSSSTSAICSGQTVTIPLTSNTTSTYTWVAADNANTTGESTTTQTSNTLSDIIINNTSGAENVVYTVTPTSTSGNCVGDAQTVTVTVNSLPTASAGASQTLTCSSPSVTLDGSGSSTGTEFQYQWTTTDGNIVSGATTASPTVDKAGTYTLTVTNTNTNCSSSSSVIINADPSFPVATVANPADLTCATTSITLNGSGSSSGTDFTYSWTTTNGNITSATDANSVTVNQPGTYVLAVTNTTNGCVSRDTVTVNQDITAPVAEAGSAADLTCTTTSIQLDGSGSASGGNISYVWSTANGTIVSGADTVNPIISAPGTYVLMVQNLDNGCTSTDSVTVTQNIAAPAASAGKDSVLTCSVTSITLDGSLSGSGNHAYQWTTADGTITAGATTTTPTVSAIGTYVITVTDTINGCTATDSVVVTQNIAAPTADAGSDTVLTCNVSSITLDGSASSSGSSFTYSWTTTNGNIVSGANTVNPVVNAAGTYTLTVTNTTNGCTSTSEVAVTSNATAVTATSTTTSASCFGKSDGSVTVQGSGASTFTYSIDGTNFVSSGTFTGLAAGSYVVKVKDEDNGCVGEVQVVITEPGEVIADLGSSVRTGVVPLTVEFTNLSLNSSSYTWDFGDSTAVVTTANATHVFTKPGIYIVTLTSSNGTCTDTDTLTIEVLGASSFEMPNVFSPNGDNINDKLIPRSKQIASFNGVIFNRWGEQVFTWTNVTDGWNGTTDSGKDAPEGTYFYMIEATGLDGKIYPTQRGHFTLVR